ncbi:hypothetical protein CDV36_003801 [Fusarium kuroshium]|uniref:Uncharacterized protein n=1 Tax=Fusarium kuroshium TaxID=2010991 RepID=A0A3M2SH89_9HYPO|nr:hypothetical protein CDV36_003801 [Fusarium kuroshium]
MLKVTNDTINNWLPETLPDLKQPEVLWFDPGPIIANISVGAVVAIPVNQSDSAFDIYGCMIDARWISTTLSGDAVALLSKGYAPFSDSIATSLAASWIGNPSYGQRVRIEPSFAEYLNPQESRSKRTIIHKMILSSGIWTSDGRGSGLPSTLKRSWEVWQQMIWHDQRQEQLLLQH